MAEIRAFAALRYSEGENLAGVTCPPYDVLSAGARQELFDRSPHAAVRIILPEGDGDTKYDEAARLLREWQENGVLRHDAAPGLYVTHTEFTPPGAETQQTRLGFVALLRVTDYADKAVLPHEKTLSAPKEDRLKLLRATRASVESIMALVDDENGELYDLLQQATKETPLLAHYDDTGDNQSHTLYQIQDAAIVERITKLIAPQPVFIADGHHRYETALTYARETGTLQTDRPEAFLLATITPFSDPGLVVLPTHRLIKNTSPDLLLTLFRGLDDHFDVAETSRADLESRLRLPVENQVVFGLITATGGFFSLTARDASQLFAALPESVAPSLRTLEPVLLEHLVLGPLLGLDAAQIATTDRLSYTRDIDEAAQKVHHGEFDMAFLLPAPPADSMRDVSLAGEVMPQKSTFFYPKLASGFLMRTLEN